jgi:DNA-binding NarL/FixJ family response regulator
MLTPASPVAPPRSTATSGTTRLHPVASSGGIGREWVPTNGSAALEPHAPVTSPANGGSQPSDHRLPPGLRVLLVDDCTLYRDNLAGLIAANGPLVNVAWDLPTLITAVRHASPDLVLLNIATSRSGMLLDSAAKTFPKARLIVLGVAEDDEATIVTCAEAGVVGYHTRNQSLEDLLQLMGRVMAGESYCSPGVSAVLLRRLSALASAREPKKKELVLTNREVQILQMLRVGMSNRDIAAQLSIAIHTVKNHVHSLLSKLGVNTRAEAAALSHRVRWTSGPGRN